MEKLEIQSPAFATGAPIPKEYTQQGSDMSPPLEITNIPKGTQSLVLVCVDPDAPDPEAPKLTFVHWVAYNLPAQDLSIPEGADLENLFPGSCEGVNGRGTVGYIGPKPPIGTHRYFFKVFAVDTVLSFNLRMCLTPLTGVSFRWPRPWEPTNFSSRRSVFRKTKRPRLRPLVSLHRFKRRRIYFDFFFVSVFFSAR